MIHKSQHLQSSQRNKTASQLEDKEDTAALKKTISKLEAALKKERAESSRLRNLLEEKELMTAFLAKRLENEKENLRSHNLSSHSNCIDLSELHSPSFKRRKSGAVHTTTKRREEGLSSKDREELTRMRRQYIENVGKFSDESERQESCAKPRRK
jgi:hypothetical protein